MKTKLKLIGIFVFLLSMAFLGKYVYDIHFNYNFKEISKGKVYKSGAIPVDKLANYVQRYKIKSIVDLRNPGTQDLKLNPELPVELQIEKNVAAKIKGLNYFNIPSAQIPTRENISAFLKVMDNPDNYPVLIHCHHGTGRAVLYSAIYRIEYEKYSNEKARFNTNDWVWFSSFDHNTPKGEYLKTYLSRNNNLVLK